MIIYYSDHAILNDQDGTNVKFEKRGFFSVVTNYYPNFQYLVEHAYMKSCKSRNNASKTAGLEVALV